MSAGVEDSNAVVRDPEEAECLATRADPGDSDQTGSDTATPDGGTGATGADLNGSGAGAAGSKTAPTAGEKPGKHHHHVLIEPEEDRWAWRRRIRQNPHQLRIYRIGVAIAGLLLICLGVITGPLPGPGGIPLVLLGLATWSSEFEWAYRLRMRFKAEIKKYGGWPTGKKVAFWVAFSAACGALAYTYLLVLGVPFWMPDVGASLLEHLPGVDAHR